MQITIPHDLAEEALKLAKDEGHGSVSPWIRGLIKRALRAAGSSDPSTREEAS